EGRTTAALCALAADDLDASAPPHVEATLLAAFRAQAKERQTTTAVAPTTTVAQSAHGFARRPARPWATRTRLAVTTLACAAAITLLLVAALRFRLTPARTPLTAD